MTIGDVLAVIAAVGLLGIGLCAALLVAALALPERTQRAGTAIAVAPGRCLLHGLGLLLPLGLIALTLSRPAAGPGRLLGVLGFAVLAFTALLGGAGLARLFSERIQQIGTHMTPFAALTRSGVLCVLAGLFPVIGWFLITPLAVLIALGGAIATLRPQTTPSLNTSPLTTSEALS